VRDKWTAQSIYEGRRPAGVRRRRRVAAFEELTPTAGYDFMLMTLKGPPRVRPLLTGPFDERDASISPDGR